MIPLLADAIHAATDPALPMSVVTALITTIIGAVIGALGHKTIQKREIGPQPFDVRKVKTEAAEIERRVKALEEAVGAIRSEAHKLHVEMIEAGEARAERIMKALGASSRGIYDKIDRLITEVRVERAQGDAQLDAKLQDMTHRVGRLEGSQLK